MSGSTPTPIEINIALLDNAFNLTKMAKINKHSHMTDCPNGDVEVSLNIPLNIIKEIFQFQLESNLTNTYHNEHICNSDNNIKYYVNGNRFPKNNLGEYLNPATDGVITKINSEPIIKNTAKHIGYEFMIYLSYKIFNANVLAINLFTNSDEMINDINHKCKHTFDLITNDTGEAKHNDESINISRELLLKISKCDPCRLKRLLKTSHPQPIPLIVGDKFNFLITISPSPDQHNVLCPEDDNDNIILPRIYKIILNIVHPNDHNHYPQCPQQYNYPQYPYYNNPYSQYPQQYPHQHFQQQHFQHQHYQDQQHFQPPYPYYTQREDNQLPIHNRHVEELSEEGVSTCISDASSEISSEEVSTEEISSEEISSEEDTHSCKNEIIHHFHQNQHPYRPPIYHKPSQKSVHYRKLYQQSQQHKHK